MNNKLNNSKPNLLKPTLIFSLVGIFIPGFTAIGIVGFQILLSSFGLECHKAWIVIWIVSSLGTLILPILFYRYIIKLKEKNLQNLIPRLTFFNIIEYTFIQASLALFFTNGRILCYASDGQNGLELVFTAWLGLPILIGFSLLFRQRLRN